MSVSIAIIGATITGNRGAEAMAETVLAKVRERFPDAILHLYSYYPTEDRAALRDSSVQVYSSTPASLVAMHFPASLLGWALRKCGFKEPPAFLPSSIKALWNADCLVDLAGVSFIDGREKFLPFNILTIWPAMLLDVPVVKFSQALGGFARPLNRMSAKLFLSRCQRVFARGDRTEAHLRALGLNGNVDRANDVAFLFDTGHALAATPAIADDEVAIDSLKERRDLVVGVCPSAVIRQKVSWDYVGMMARLVEDETAAGRGVVLFPNAVRERAGERLRNNDLPVIREIMRRLSSKAAAHVVAIDGDIDAAGIKRLIAKLDAAIVSRFHAMVGALSLGVPTLVIGWSHKYLEVMALFDQEGRVFDYANAPYETLRVEIDKLIHDLGPTRDTLLSRLPAVCDGAASQFDYLFERLSRK